MIQWVVERAERSTHLDRVIVATDDTRIEDAVKEFNGEVLMTSSSHKSGTDRVCEVASRVEADCYVNIQGDEPLIEPDNIDRVARPFLEDCETEMTTLCAEIGDPRDVFNPNVVKVLKERDGSAIYFSRAPLPFPRRAPSLEDFSLLWRERQEIRRHYRRHIGLYGYRRDVLLALGESGPAEIELMEGLEQLRVLEAGYRILVIDAVSSSIGVDTAEDLERVRERLAGV
jgi:3-deoxy-manno-octulosonate cytidylyltransferase (CMP-KDO synthetase)